VSFQRVLRLSILALLAIAVSGCALVSQVTFYGNLLRANQAGLRFRRTHENLALGVSFSDRSDVTLDLFSPEEGDRFPVLIFVHGGGWNSYDKELFTPVAMQLLPQEMVVVIPDYTLHPSATYRQMAREVADATAWVLENIKTDKGQKVTEIEGYGYGKGYVHGFEQMCKVLQDLDVLSSRGVHSILICHDCVANFDDPAQVGEHKRYEPRLYRSASGNTDTRLRVREWADAVLFGTYDMKREKDGRVVGQGTRVIFTQDRPGFMAKSSLPSESCAVPVAHEYDGTIWQLLFSN
jgi:hypothetical protein